MTISPTADADERLAVLEKKVRDIDALVKGLVNEMLDLKSVIRKLSRHDTGAVQGPGTSDDGQQQTDVFVPPVPAPSLSGDSVTISPGSGLHKDAGPEDDRPEPVMARIMQPDGTFKMEPRRGDASTTSSSASYGRDRKSTSFRSRKSP